MRPPRPLAPTLLAALTLACPGCVSRVRHGGRFVPPPEEPPAAAGPAVPAPRPPPAAPAPAAGPVIADGRDVGTLTPADWAEIQQAWTLFVRKDKAWPQARARWLAKGGAAPYVLGENLLRYFMSASAYGDRRDLNWVAVSAREVGAPAVGYFANLLVLDAWPLKEPVRVPAKDGTSRLVTSWVNDDLTRQHAALVLAAIGPPAVARLSSPEVLRSAVPSARRFAMYALGRIGTDPAVDALAAVSSSADWQDRGAAVKGLGLALLYAKNERARPLLERARTDRDDFVRKKAEEALAGRTRWEF